MGHGNHGGRHGGHGGGHGGHGGHHLSYALFGIIPGARILLLLFLLSLFW